MQNRLSRWTVRLSRLVVALGLLALPAAAPAEPAGDPAADGAIERAAGLLQAATVTVRVSPLRPADGGAVGLDGVTVCTGVSLGDGLIATFTGASANARFRITLSDGAQAEATLRAIDYYSGLSLLEMERRDVPALTLATQLPKVGAPLLSASAAGIEPPVVSLGILSAAERSLPGAGLPPLLQCDLRATETSSGAAVVDRAGNLVGIVAATTTPSQRAGWTYAVPVRDLERLLRARRDGQIVVLKRRRPTLGLTLGPGEQEGTVKVERVEPGGPADRAGIRAHDLVLEADGRKLRSAYQAVDIILKKQPGDKVSLTIEHDGRSKLLEVVLAGGAAETTLPGPGDEPQVLVGPQLKVQAIGRDQIVVRTPAGVEEVGVNPRASPGRVVQDELVLLRAQLEAFERVIDQLQKELRRRDDVQEGLEAEVKRLTAELAELRKRTGAERPER